MATPFLKRKKVNPSGAADGDSAPSQGQPRSLKGSSFIALDLGTKNTLAYVSGHGKVFNQPSAIAYDKRTNKVIAFGTKASEMEGKTNESIDIVFPLRDGVISDLDATRDLLEQVFTELQIMNLWKNAIVLLACPSEVTQIEREALIDIAKKMNARVVVIEQEAKLAALGAGINIWLPTGQLIVDIGGGTTDIAVLSAGDVVVARSLKYAGNYFDKEVSKYLRVEYNLEIGPQAAEDLKIKGASLIKRSDEKPISVSGRDVISGLPRSVTVNPDEIRNLLLTPFAKITDAIVQVLEATPPELTGDILKTGITVSGGGALISGIDRYFAEIFQVPVTIAKDPLNGVINGAKAYEKKVYEIIDTKSDSRKRGIDIG